MVSSKIVFLLLAVVFFVSTSTRAKQHDERGVLLKACMMNVEINNVCLFCQQNKDDYKCAIPPGIGERAIACHVYGNDMACEWCYQHPKEEICAGLIMDDMLSGPSLKDCLVEGNQTACAECKEHPGTMRCFRGFDVGENSVKCGIHGDREACDYCKRRLRKNLYYSICNSFPGMDRGQILKQCINKYRNETACDYCREHTTERKCQKPETIGELTIDCLLNGNKTACEYCDDVFFQPKCNEYHTATDTWPVVNFVTLPKAKKIKSLS